MPKLHLSPVRETHEGLRSCLAIRTPTTITRTTLQHAGHTVTEACTGAEALAMTKGDCPDVLLLDMPFSDLDGLEVTRRLKADDGTRGIPVVMLTARAFKSNREAAVRAGADKFANAEQSSRTTSSTDPAARSTRETLRRGASTLRSCR